MTNPTPWTAKAYGGARWLVIDATGHVITSQLNEQQATHIAKCVNSHDALVAALRDIADTRDDPITDDSELAQAYRQGFLVGQRLLRNIARAALAEAEGGAG